ENEPTGADQRVATYEPDAAQDRQRCEPIPAAAGILAVADGNAADHAADSGALHECHDHGTDAEAQVPDERDATTAAELEGHAAEDQAEQQQQGGDVKGRQEYRICGGKGREQRGPDHDQPGFVAVPEGRDRVDHLLAQLAVAHRAEQDADAKVEAVEHGIDQDRAPDDGSPEQREVRSRHRQSPVSAWAAIASGRLGVTSVSTTSVFGPSCSSRYK